MIQIPFTTYPCYTQDIKIEGIYYRFLFVWNTRSETWSLTISNVDEEVIISGIVLVINYDLLHGFHHLDLPKGGLFVIDSTGNTSKIAYDDFSGNRRLKLIYMTEAEVASI